MRQDTLDELVRFLTEKESQMEEDCATARRHGRITSMIMRSALLLVMVLAVAAAWLLYLLSIGLQQNLDSAARMTDGFSDISSNMQVITRDVVAMNHSVQSIIVIDADVSKMATTLVDMDQGVGGLSGDISKIASHMYHFDVSLADMESQMMVLSNDVRRMGGSINQISKPMRMMNAFMPW